MRLRRLLPCALGKQSSHRSESRTKCTGRTPTLQFPRTTDRPKYADLAYAARVPEFHAEPYLHLAGLSHKSALIAWGAFYFKARSHKQWKLVDDRDLRHVHPPRREGRLRRAGSSRSRRRCNSRSNSTTSV